MTNIVKNGLLLHGHNMHGIKLVMCFRCCYLSIMGKGANTSMSRFPKRLNWILESTTKNKVMHLLQNVNSLRIQSVITVTILVKKNNKQPVNNY